MTTSRLTETALKWVVGITVPALIFVITILFSISSTVDARASELEVLKVRVQSLEESVRDIYNAANQIQKAAQDMRVHQATFQTELKIKISDVQRDMSDIKIKLARKRY